MSESIELIGVVRAKGTKPSLKKYFKRKVKKAWKIGAIGTLNGFRMRGWFRDQGPPPIDSLARSYDVPYHVVENLNSEQTQRVISEMSPDLGISVGNGYIRSSIFSIPTNGMINFHSERLPDYKGAQSVIWPIYEGEIQTGLSIHQMTKSIDGGRLLYKESYPIVLRSTLKSTVRASTSITKARIGPAVRHVCDNYEMKFDRGNEQKGGDTYTTPSSAEFLQMLAQHRRLFQEYGPGMIDAGHS